jgi:hypothetical protein
VPDRVINGHCDCMFLYNTHQWAWARVAGMVAPRPLLFANSDADTIFPMDGDERVINRLKRIYSLMGASDLVESVVSIGDHAYRQDIRQAVARFMNTRLKNDPRPVLDTEVDLVTGDAPEAHPIRPEHLRVFPTDVDFPKDAINGRIDYEFVPMAKPAPPEPGQFESWRKDLLARLREKSFHHFPERIPAAVSAGTTPSSIVRLSTESPITIRLRPVRGATAEPKRIWLVVARADLNEAPPAWLKDYAGDQDAIYVCEPRGIGGSQWTTRNPPNYVERSHYLLGRTVDSGRVWDIAAAARYLRASSQRKAEVYLAGEGAAAVLAAYAALLEPDIAGLVLARPPASHTDPAAPQILGVLRVLDIPQAMGLLAPRPLTLLDAPADCRQTVADLYRRAGAAQRLR